MQKSRELDAGNSFSITEICSDTFCLVVSLLKVQREKRWQRLKGGHFQVKDVHSLSGIKKSQSWESYRLVSNTDNTLLLGCAQFVSWEKSLSLALYQLSPLQSVYEASNELSVVVCPSAIPPHSSLRENSLSNPQATLQDMSLSSGSHFGQHW